MSEICLRLLSSLRAASVTLKIQWLQTIVSYGKNWMERVHHRHLSVLLMVVNQVHVPSISPFEAEDDPQQLPDTLTAQ